MAHRKNPPGIVLNTGREQPAPFVPFVAAVFNLDQVEGIARPADDALFHIHRLHTVVARRVVRNASDIGFEAQRSLT